MPTRNINLTPEMDDFVDARIKSGQYANASEVLRAGLRALAQDEREDKAKLKALRMALQAGEDSGVADEGAVDRLLEDIRLRAVKAGQGTKIA
jgi:antitoxin ParD1/3/4